MLAELIMWEYLFDWLAYTRDSVSSSSTLVNAYLCSSLSIVIYASVGLFLKSLSDWIFSMSLRCRFKIRCYPNSVHYCEIFQGQCLRRKVVGFSPHCWILLLVSPETLLVSLCNIIWMFLMSYYSSSHIPQKLYVRNSYSIVVTLTIKKWLFISIGLGVVKCFITLPPL